MKTLFLKSNLLHIRTNEGVFEVSNPEVAYIDDEGYGWWAYGLNAREKGIVRKIGITRADTVPHDVSIEWPGGIEFVFQHRIGNGEWQSTNEYYFIHLASIPGSQRRKLARLLPKEEKKDYIMDINPTMSAAESAYKGSEQSEIVNEAINKHRWESDYKEPQDKEQLIGLIIDDFKNGKEIFVPAVESSEPQEKLKKGDAGFKWFTCPTCDGRGSVPQDSAPSESQEDFAISFAKFCQVDLKGRTFNDLMSEFKATRNP